MKYYDLAKLKGGKWKGIIMFNKHFKMNEEVYIFDNRKDEPRIIKAIITGAVKHEGIYDYVYQVEGKTESLQEYRRPYQIYKTLDELKEDILNYAVLANVDK